MGLSREGYRVTGEADGRLALSRFRRDPFDVVVLDLMLPSLDGFEVCRQIRQQSRVPIVMVTARTDTTDVVVGLESGADDYVTKPFEIKELVARIRAVLRRVSEVAGVEELSVGGLDINSASFKVRRDGREIDLSATEFRLLLEMAQRPGQVFTREVLLDRVWNYDYLGDSRLVDMAVKRLRDKVERDPSQPRLIVTVRGVGYRLDG